MENSVSFWIIAIQDSCVTVTLANKKNEIITPSSVGSTVDWSISDPHSLVVAVDQSLSFAASEANLDQNMEPDQAAFIVPPHWVNNDGKIISSYLKFIESFCNQLKLKPLGFISNDEAIVEEANKREGFPSSFVLVNIDNVSINISLVYLGKIKTRIRKTEINASYPEIVQSSLNQLNSESTLPPQIILFGKTSHNDLNEFKNYSWINKNIETFLHHPDIKLYSQLDLAKIYSQSINFQINPSTSHNTNIPQADIIENDPIIPDNNLDDIGFSLADDPEKIKTEEDPLPIIPVRDNLPKFDNSLNLDLTPETIIESPIPAKSSPKIAFSFSSITSFFKKIIPKNTLNPSLKKTKLKPVFLVLFSIPLLYVLSIFFAKSEIAVFVTPYTFSKSTDVTLDPNATEIDTSSGILPVELNNFSVQSTVSTKATGTKTIGEKSKGEINIINSQYNSVNFPKGTVLVDGNGHNFELNNDIQVASASADLNASPPVSVLGQTKAVVVASDIGPEYNLSQDTKLTFKNASSSQVVAKVTSPFTGGTKEEIKAVGSDDLESLKTEIGDKNKQEIDNKINEIADRIDGTLKINDGKIEYSREVGEKADEVEANQTSTANIFIMNNEKKLALIREYLKDEDGFSKDNIDTKNFQLTFTIKSVSDEKAKGTLKIEGKSLPAINTDDLKSQIKLKTSKSAQDYIKNKIPRAYNINIKNSAPLNFLDLLPLNPGSINISIKTESL